MCVKMFIPSLVRDETQSRSLNGSQNYENNHVHPPCIQRPVKPRTFCIALIYTRTHITITQWLVRKQEMRERKKNQRSIILHIHSNHHQANLADNQPPKIIAAVQPRPHIHHRKSSELHSSAAIWLANLDLDCISAAFRSRAKRHLMKH